MYNFDSTLILIFLFYHLNYNKTSAESKKILIVDNDRDMLSLLSKIMRKANYKVSTASNGKKAVRQIRADKTIRIVLLDQNIPGMSGVEVLEQINKYRKDINTIIISKILTDEIIKKALTLGVKEVYTKPFNLDRLLTTVNHLMKFK